MRKLAELWEPAGEKNEKKVKCQVCNHYCVILPGKRGFCRTRENVDGQLFTLVYGAGIHRGSNDPIEKKPLYHFLPGSAAFSIATVGCNFRCKMCQNWEISQSFPDSNGKIAEFNKQDQEIGSSFGLTEITPEQVVKTAKKLGSRSIAYTYNEPTIWFEFVKDTAILAKREGLKNILVTNGYSSPEVNAEFVKFIDAANVDIKAFSDEFYKRVVGVPSVKPVLATCEYYKQHGVHVELTNLIIPNENDNLEEIRSMVRWVKEHLGPATPLHFSAYHPDYRMNQPNTPSKTILAAWNIAKEEGLLNIFMGNVMVEEVNNTKCSKCGALLVERRGYQISPRGISDDGHCTKCGEPSTIFMKKEKK